MNIFFIGVVAVSYTHLKRTDLIKTQQRDFPCSNTVLFRRCTEILQSLLGLHRENRRCSRRTKSVLRETQTGLERQMCIRDRCMQGLNVLPRRLGNGFPTTNPTDTFHCKDGWFALSIGSDKQWLDFAREAGRDDWGEGSVYAHDPDRSMKHYFGELDQQLKDYFATISIDEADQICRRAMVPGGPCNTVEELMKDEQVADRGMMITVCLLYTSRCV